jgi:hypothetical protein
MLKDLAHWPRLSLAASHEARPLILITLGSCPRIPHPKLSVSAPLSIPLLGGVTITRFRLARLIGEKR